MLPRHTYINVIYMPNFNDIFLIQYEEYLIKKYNYRSDLKLNLQCYKENFSMYSFRAKVQEFLYNVEHIVDYILHYGIL